MINPYKQKIKLKDSFKEPEFIYIYIYKKEAQIVSFVNNSKLLIGDSYCLSKLLIITEFLKRC